jgi:hypothetical protein
VKTFLLALVLVEVAGIIAVVKEELFTHLAFLRKKNTASGSNHFLATLMLPTDIQTSVFLWKKANCEIEKKAFSPLLLNTSSILPVEVI